MKSIAEKRKATLFPKQRITLQTLGENIKLARKRRDFTQQLISERTGLSRVTIRKIEKGDEGVSIGHYLMVLSALNLADELATIAQEDELGRKLQDAKLLTRKKSSASTNKEA
ncbi:MAG TPA: helix-turn-helix domain-containing protein [Thiothrix sp.]|nr:helix-turn-helix domain-containing protein [Thiothrix sp.]